jgi:glycosyltransferase involved in cell wall biosynthesis
MSFQEMLTYSVNADAGILLYKNSDLGNFFQAPGRLTEYLGCGLPVLASNFTGLENLILKYDVGICVNAEDARAVTQAIVRLRQRINSGELTAAGIRSRFEEHFCLEQWIPGLVQAFESVLGRNV